MKITSLVGWCVLSVFALFALSSCGAAGGSPSPSSEMPVALEGYLQKGPFILGSTVTVQEMNSSFGPAGASYATRTLDDLGSFRLRGTTINTDYVEIMSNGYYFNEITGALSDSTFTLRSLSYVPNEANTVNVNILTTLTEDRIIYLLEHGTATYAAARAQAESELLTVFHIAATDIADAAGVSQFDAMDITQLGDSNAALLAISAVLHQDNTTSQLSELIAKIDRDIEADGTLDSATYVTELRNNGKALSLSEVRTNLGDRYSSLDSAALIDTIPPFEDFVDSDGDDIINKNDTDTRVWARSLPYAPSSTNAAPWHERWGLASVVFDNKIWIIGGASTTNGVTTYYDDVWSSPDGIAWTRATANADWAPPTYPSVVSFNGKMWLFSDALGDVFYSTDGVTWSSTPAPWVTFADSYVDTVVYDNKIWAVYSSINTGFDVYNSSDGATWTYVARADNVGSILYFRLVAFNNKIWVLDGVSPFGGDDIWSSTDGVTWTKEVEFPPYGGRQKHAAVVFDNKLWVLGGDGVDGSSAYTGDAWYSSDGVNWTQSSDTAHWASRYAHSSVVTNLDGKEKMWVLGGRTDANTTGLKDVWYYSDYANYSPSELATSIVVPF